MIARYCRTSFRMAFSSARRRFWNRTARFWAFSFAASVVMSNSLHA
jgi:hypothetical protein